jgi:NAD(P)-dependent dehydrogenase (short-subunit alcohol dehydrogenase family)
VPESGLRELRRALLDFVATPTSVVLRALAAPDARLCIDMRRSLLSDDSASLLALLEELQPAQRAGMTAFGHDGRTVLVAPAAGDRPESRKVLVFSHPEAGRVSEVVVYTDGTVPPAETSSVDAVTPIGATRSSVAAGLGSPFELERARVLVTASSDALGFEIASAFLRAGASVAFHGARPSLSVPEPRERAMCAYVRADLSNPAEAERLVLESVSALGGPITILVNNLGPWDSTPLSAISDQAWLEGMQANLGAALQLCQLVAPGMREAGRGSIINISASSAYTRDHGLYGFAKAALGLATESLAVELAPYITVNAVAPGQIEESVPLMNSIDPGAVPHMLSRTPAGRFVTRAEIADLVVALTGPTFDMVTGAVIPADGGYRIPRS